jgi:hypothetical protein
VKKALHKEYVKYCKSALHQIRSGYADNKKVIPEGHKAGLVRQLVPLDQRFENAGLRLHDDAYIKAVRTAKQDPIDMNALQSIFDHTNGWNFQDAAEVVMPLLAGLLMFDDEADRGSPEINDIEGLILQTDERCYETAREIFWALLRGGISAVLGTVKTDGTPEAHQQALIAIDTSVKVRPEWASLLFTLCLSVASQRAQ